MGISLFDHSGYKTALFQAKLSQAKLFQAALYPLDSAQIVLVAFPDNKNNRQKNAPQA
jgi:hypothetical protein|tara:strand:- start:22 stop:195 length:174 start_codon:yes stop_codon:yes gene_type:complete